jgi:hypothetical protein
LLDIFMVWRTNFHENMNHTTYHAPWGKCLRWLSALSCVLLLGIPAGVLLSSKTNGPERWICLLLPLLLFVTALFLIRSYTLEPGTLVIRRLLWSTRLSLAGLQSGTAQPNAMRWSLRLCGNGGMFSITGWYRNRTLGVYRAFVTDLKSTVVLKFSRRTVVVSPERPEEFAAEISNRKS